MKKLFLILLLTMPVLSQTVDTANWSFVANGGDGKFTSLTNRGTYYGKSAGTVSVPIQFNAGTIDTASWSFVANGGDGKYVWVTNRSTFYGKTAGTVLVRLITDFNPSPSYTNITSTGNIQGDSIHTTYDSTVQQDAVNLTVTGTATMATATVIGTMTFTGQALFVGGTGTTSTGSVTINAQCGIVTIGNPDLATEMTINLTNSYITASSVVVVSLVFTDIAHPVYITGVTSSSGSCTIGISGADVPEGGVKVHFFVAK